MLASKVPWSLRDVIKEICKQYKDHNPEAVYLDDDWCLYAKDDNLTLDSPCFIDQYPTIDDKDNEIYPPFISENNLQFMFMDSLLQDVIMNCLDQDSAVTPEKILEAITYYSKHDTFLMLE